MLQETYLANLRNLDLSAHDKVVYVMRDRGNNLLAPTAKLLRDFKLMEAHCRDTLGLDDVEAHNRAWDEIGYERRFSMAFWGNEKAQDALLKLMKEAETKKVVLVCFEKPPKKCHRHLLMKFAKQLGEKNEQIRKSET